MSHEWSELAWETSKYACGAGGALIVKWLYDKSKRFHVHPSEFNFRFLEIDDLGGWNYRDTPGNQKQGRYHFVLRLMSRKSQSIALHRTAVEFRDENGLTKVKDTDISHGQSYSYAGGISYETLTEILVPPNEWVTEKLHGFVPDYETIRGTTVWFCGQTEKGKRLSWRIGSISKELTATPV